jgi:hypothetical protein
VLARSDPLPERIEAAVSAWVDFVGDRPTLARLILREVADATPERRSAVLEHTRPFFELVRKQILDREDFSEVQLAEADAVQIASAVAGATVFFVAAMPTLTPDLDIDPLSRRHLAAHKREVLQIVHRLFPAAGS